MKERDNNIFVPINKVDNSLIWLDFASILIVKDFVIRLVTMTEFLQHLKTALTLWTDYVISAFQQYFRRSRRKGNAAAAAAAHRSVNADKENLVAIGGIAGTRNNNNKLSSSSNGSSNSVASNGSVKKSHSAEFSSVCDTIQETDFDRLVTPPGLGVDQREWMASHCKYT